MRCPRVGPSTAPFPLEVAGVIRFALYGRTTSPDWRASRAWQYARGKALVEPHGGVIVVEFFDIDKSRSIPPQRRPEASRLLAALADPNRGFEAVVVGEPQRAFYGNHVRVWNLASGRPEHTVEGGCWLRDRVSVLTLLTGSGEPPAAR